MHREHADRIAHTQQWRPEEDVVGFLIGEGRGRLRIGYRKPLNGAQTHEVDGLAKGPLHALFGYGDASGGAHDEAGRCLTTRRRTGVDVDMELE